MKTIKIHSCKDCPFCGYYCEPHPNIAHVTCDRTSKTEMVTVGDFPNFCPIPDDGVTDKKTGIRIPNFLRPQAG